ncbi:G-type lectin S-receptor-like serine/threonine-protein kinase At4g03230 [Pistacia vera]|uniref:G-type lectin S-receptor-like serine/threonine-protein kinase At4g03230 n=1 Tax=Pistacia vera TaxID=55513 RepID=UPI0012635179|nr:G-type lectin S-receptor-like serine/threonine-protein kinase At4g03230 [Pistacia vera]
MGDFQPEGMNEDPGYQGVREAMNHQITAHGTVQQNVSNTIAKTGPVMRDDLVASPSPMEQVLAKRLADVEAVMRCIRGMPVPTKKSGISRAENTINNLTMSAWELWREGAVLELVHPKLRDSCFEDPVLRCINVALLCVEHNPVDRPSMSAVICMLGSDVVKLSKPKQPAFSTERIPVDQDNSKEIKAENCTINNLTMTAVDLGCYMKSDAGWCLCFVQYLLLIFAVVFGCFMNSGAGSV